MTSPQDPSPDSKQSVFWVADNVQAAIARVIKYFAWDHQIALLNRKAWSGQLAMARQDDVAKAVTDPQVQLYGVRLGRCMADDETPKKQGFEEGDVLILLPDGSPQWLQILQATRVQFPERLSPDLPFTDWTPLAQVLQHKP